MNNMQCPQCGTLNETGRALCSNCQMPLTAYSGQLRGEAYEGKLAGQVDRLRTRPVSISLMALYLAIATVMWPLRAIASAFVDRAHLNAENTNYLASAFGAIRPIMTTIVYLPIAVVTLGIAWYAFTQHTRGWHLCLGALGVFTVYLLVTFNQNRMGTILGLAVTIALAVLWTRESTKSWFGIS